MIVLHIGTDKTGSTAIQKMLYWNRSILKKHGYLYPETGMMHYDHARLSIHLSDNDFKILDQLKNEISINNTKHIILSHEGLYHLSHDQLSHFNKFLVSLKRGTIKIILYLRRQDEMLESGILQQIKTNIKVLNSNILEELPYRDHLDYFTLTKKFDSIFGEENVVLKPYSKKFLPKDDSLLKDFLNTFIHQDFSINDVVIPEKDQNPSIDAISAHVISFLYKLGLDSLYFDDIVDQLLWIQKANKKSNKKLFNKQQRVNLLDKYSESNGKIKERINADLFNIENNESFESISDKEIAERLSHLYLRNDFILGCQAWYGNKGNIVEKIKKRQIVLLNGWHNPEDWGCWSNATQDSTLVFRIARTKAYSKKIKIKINTRYLGLSDTSSHLTIKNNEAIQILKETIIIANTDNLTSSGNLVFLNFSHKNPISPSRLGINEDSRILGCGIEDISFEEVI